MAKLPAGFMKKDDSSFPTLFRSTAIAQPKPTEVNDATTPAVAAAPLADTQASPVSLVAATPEPEATHVAVKVAKRVKDVAAPADSMEHRFTVRVAQAQWLAVQNACHELTVSSGETVSAGEMVRRIVDDWARRQRRAANE